MTIIKTVDILITINKEEVLLIKRTKEPFLDKLVMPGGHVEEADESLKHACLREALEEINFVANLDEISPLITLDKEGGDPRPGERISYVFTINLSTKTRLKNCEARSDAKSFHIKKICDLNESDIGFDHWDAIQAI